MKQYRKRERVNKKHIWFMLCFPIVIFYYELVFRLSTDGNIFSLSMLCTLLFSVFYGGIGYLLTSISKKEKVNHIITACLIALLALPYLIEYFVFRQFKVLYDVQTVTGGASDAMGGFTNEIFRLIFSFDGFIKIFFFILPTVLYLFLLKRYIPTVKATAKRRITAIVSMVSCYLLSLLIVLISGVLSNAYKNEYNFQSAVNNFGLVTGVRLDVKYIIFGNSSSVFQNTEDPNVSIDNTPTEYPYNKMDLNLEGGSGKVKELNSYVSTLTPSKQNEYTGIFKGKNLIFITAEAFSAEVIDKDLTPTLYRLSTKGINFTDYYQPASAGTTGGEYQNIFGMLPTAGGRSFKNTAKHLNYFTMGSQLDRLGYFGMAFHNNSYTYYDRHITHKNLGYSGGYMGYGNGMEKYVKNKWPQSDLEMIQGTLPLYVDKQPFNVYYMSVSGHSNYLLDGNAMTKKNWDKVKDLNYSNQVKGYLAANLELENALQYLVSELELKGIADDTVICISTDHFPYGLDDDAGFGDMPYLCELYGYNVTNYFQRDHSRLIIWCQSLEEEEPIIVDSPTFSLDILPTLSNLFGTEFDSRLFPGRDVFSDADALVFNTNYDWKTELGTYYASKGKFVQNDPSKELPEGYVERMKTVVRNKIRYCTLALETDYYRKLFG